MTEYRDSFLRTTCCRTAEGKLMSTDDLRKAFERYRAEYEAGQKSRQGTER